MTELLPLGENDDRARCLRMAYAAISRGDAESALEALPLHPDVELMEPPQFVAGGHHRGAGEAARYFRQSRAAWDQLELVPEAFLDGGERVVVLLRARGTPHSGKATTEAAFADVVTIADGRLTRIEAYVDRDAALRSVAARFACASTRAHPLGLERSGWNSIKGKPIKGKRSSRRRRVSLPPS